MTLPAFNDLYDHARALGWKVGVERGAVSEPNANLRIVLTSPSGRPVDDIVSSYVPMDRLNRAAGVLRKSLA